MGPLAQQLLQQGQAEEIWDQLQKLDFEESSQRPCIMYKKNNAEGDKGQCSVYLYRPLICRVFGAFARRNKYGAKELSLCKLIADKVNLSAEEKASKAQEAPAVALWRKRLEELNPNPGGALLPINKALKLALQDVLLKNHYRDNNSKTVLP
jgi:Fe-S-cluster containining protein